MHIIQCSVALLDCVLGDGGVRRGVMSVLRHMDAGGRSAGRRGAGHILIRQWTGHWG